MKKKIDKKNLFVLIMSVVVITLGGFAVYKLSEIVMHAASLLWTVKAGFLMIISALMVAYGFWMCPDSIYKGCKK